MNELARKQTGHNNPFLSESIRTRRDFYSFLVRYYTEREGGERKVKSEINAAMVKGFLTYGQVYKLKKLIREAGRGQEKKSV